METLEVDASVMLDGVPGEAGNRTDMRVLRVEQYAEVVEVLASG